MKKILFTLALLALPAVLRAQERPLTVDANFLTRGEARVGGLADDTDDIADNAYFILERTLLGLRYDKAGLSAKLTAQHCGTWGTAEGGYFNVYEAWIQLTGHTGWFAKIGRQNLSYDDQRIFGSDDWAMTAMSHDALKLGYEGHGHKVHLIGAFNQNPENMEGGTYFSGGLQPYKALEAFWYHYDIRKINLGISALFANIGMQSGEKGEPSEKTFQQQMAGLYVSFTPNKWTAEAAYYRQMGKEEHGLPIDAWMTSFKTSYTPGPHASFYGGYDYLSGDAYVATPGFGQMGMPRHETIRGFSSLYGSHHKFYGAMDFFYVTTYVAGFTPGLQNIYAGGKWMPNDKWTLDAAYHFLATATKLEKADRPLGHEVELSASWQFRKEAKISLGYTFMRGTETMVVLKKTSHRRQLHWGWLMLSVTPDFLSGKRH